MKSSSRRAQVTSSVYSTNGASYEKASYRGCCFNGLFLSLFLGRSDVEYSEDHCHLVSSGFLVLLLNRTPSAARTVSLGNASSTLSSL